MQSSPRPWLLLIAFGLLSFGGAAAQNATTETTRHQTVPEPLEWIDSGTTQTSPIALSFRHSILYDPDPLTIQVEESHWNLQRLDVRLFSGRALVQGRGTILPEAPDDVATTLTLEGIDLQGVLQFLTVPRANEIQALLSGMLAVAIRDGDWEHVEIDLHGEEGSVYLSRPLIKDLLGTYLGNAVTPEQVDQTLSHYYGDQTMIPLSDVRLRGELGRQMLELSIPLRNQALNIDLNPRIERDLLWEIWEYLRDAGLKDVEDIDWFRLQGE